MVRGMSSLNSKPKKKLNAKQLRALAEHEKWLKSRGVHTEQIMARKPAKVDKFSVEQKTTPAIPSHGNGFAPITGNKSVFDSAWKKMYDDDPEMAERERIARAQAEDKKSRIGPLYSKGPLQYISDGTDLTDVGKKK